jgi:hypothetical protein
MAVRSRRAQAHGVDFPRCPPRYKTPYFSHIMGGYSAGYYAYIWSEVLDADTVEWFKQHGGLTRANGDHFRDTLLSRGGSKDALQLFQDFAGRAGDRSAAEASRPGWSADDSKQPPKPSRRRRPPRAVDPEAGNRIRNRKAKGPRMRPFSCSHPSFGPARSTPPTAPAPACRRSSNHPCSASRPCQAECASSRTSFQPSCESPRTRAQSLAICGSTFCQSCRDRTRRQFAQGSGARRGDFVDVAGAHGGG